MKKIVLALMFVLILNVMPAVAEDDVIKDGKTVKFHYALSVEDKIIETSQEDKPIEYVQGKHMIVPGLEKQLEGLKAGDVKEIVVEPEEGYGKIDPAAIVEMKKSDLATDTTPEIGMLLQLKNEAGDVLMGIVQEVKKDSIVVNFNHPLAGQELKFNVKIIEVK